MMLPTAGERVFAVQAAAATPAQQVSAAMSDVAGRAGWALLPLDGVDAALSGCDALLAVLDGDIGIDPIVQRIWELARDLDLPRALVAVRTAHGRADFDEIVAMVRRVLEPDAVARYLPLHREDGAGYEGLYDVLRCELLVAGESLPADMEHRELTTDAHSALVDELAHAGLPDEALSAHLQGMPVSLPALEAIWASPYVTPVLPGDDAVAAGVLARWCSGVPAAACAIVWRDGVSFDADAVGEPVGVGIRAGAARVWGAPRECELEIVGPSGRRGTTVCHGPLCTDPLIEPGDTLRPPGSSSVASLPGS